MTERGRVEGISGDLVRVRQERGISCFGCMNQECKETRGLITARNGTGRPLEPGQLVETEIPLSSIFAQILGSLVPPFLAFVLFFAASALVFPGIPESARAALGVLGLFACAGGLYLYRRGHPPASGPEVIRVLE